MRADLINMIKETMGAREIKLYDSWDGCTYSIEKAYYEGDDLYFEVNVCGCEEDELTDDSEEDGFVLLDEIDDEV